MQLLTEWPNFCGDYDRAMGQEENMITLTLKPLIHLLYYSFTADDFMTVTTDSAVPIREKK